MFTKYIWKVCIIRNSMLACCSCCWYNKIVDLHFSPNFQVSSMSQWIFNGSLVFACAPLTEIGSEAQWIIHFCQLIHHVLVNVRLQYQIARHTIWPNNKCRVNTIEPIFSVVLRIRIVIFQNVGSGNGFWFFESLDPDCDFWNIWIRIRNTAEKALMFKNCYLFPRKSYDTCLRSYILIWIFQKVWSGLGIY